MVKLAGFEPAPGFPGAPLAQPRPSFGGTRTRKAHRASRDLTSPDTGPSEGGARMEAKHGEIKTAAPVVKSTPGSTLPNVARTTLRMKQTIEVNAGASHKNSPRHLAAAICFVMNFFRHATFRNQIFPNLAKCQRPRTRRCAYIRRHQLERGRSGNSAFKAAISPCPITWKPGKGSAGGSSTQRAADAGSVSRS